MNKTMLRYWMAACMLLAGWQASARQPLEPGDVVGTSAMEELKKSLPDATLQGQYIILDFFATWCAPCVKSLDHYRELKNHYGSKVDVVLLSQQDSAMLKQWLTARGIGFPVVAGHNIFYKLFPHKSIPHVVLMSRQGKILAITDKDAITVARMDSLFAGRQFQFRRKRDNMTFNRLAPLAAEVGSYRYRSMFGGPRSGIGGGAIVQPTPLFQDSGRSRFMAHNMDIVQMYWLAFSKMMGTTLNKRLVSIESADPVLDLQQRPDSYEKVNGISYEEWAASHLFCYELITAAPLVDSTFFGYVFHDLNRQFGFEAVVEPRQMPCWVITTTGKDTRPAVAGSNKARVAFRGGDTLQFIKKRLAVVADFLNFNLHDWPVRPADGLADMIVTVEIYPYATGLSAKAAMACLRAAGLELTFRQSAPVPVLVIRDK